MHNSVVFRGAVEKSGIVIVAALLVGVGALVVPTSRAAASPRDPGTKTITVTRGGRAFERTVLDPIQVRGRLVRSGSVIVRFKEGVSTGAREDAHRAAGAVEV